HHDHISSDLYSSPLLDPQVKHIVQVDIGQKRTDAPALDRPPLHLSMLALLQHPSLEPLLDQPYYPPIRHPLLNQSQHPFIRQRSDAPPNVGIEHPVHFPLHDPNTERVQRLMRTPLGSKPVGEVHKFLRKWRSALRR